MGQCHQFKQRKRRTAHVAAASRPPLWRRRRRRYKCFRNPIFTKLMTLPLKGKAFGPHRRAVPRSAPRSLRKAGPHRRAVPRSAPRSLRKAGSRRRAAPRSPLRSLRKAGSRRRAARAVARSNPRFAPSQAARSIPRSAARSVPWSSPQSLPLQGKVAAAKQLTEEVHPPPLSRRGSWGGASVEVSGLVSVSVSALSSFISSSGAIVGSGVGSTVRPWNSFSV